MTYKFTGNLKGVEEHIFRQSVMGAVGHIVTNYDEFHALITDPTEPEIRIDTWCGKNYKYNPKYSSMDGRSRVVRNACEYCFTEYDPDERTERERVTRDERKQTEGNLDSDLPF